MSKRCGYGFFVEVTRLTTRANLEIGWGLKISSCSNLVGTEMYPSFMNALLSSAPFNIELRDNSKMITEKMSFGITNWLIGEELKRCHFEHATVVIRG
jgi:hypothetical protein